MSLPDFVNQSNVDLTNRVSGFFGNEVKHDSLITGIEDYYKNTKALHDNVVVMEAEVERDRTEVFVNTTEVRGLAEQVEDRFYNINIMRDEAVDAKDRAVIAETNAVNASNSAQSSAGRANLSAELAKGSETNAKVSEDNSKVSETESQKYFQYTYDIYEDLRKGQTYRGTWNPHTGAYPDNQGTNSVWDVILNENETEYTWNGIKWYWGDRLVYVKDTNVYQQIEAGLGGGVISVNNKKGAVVLNASDVGAVPLDGHTPMTGYLNTVGVNMSADEGYIVNNEGEAYVQSTKTFGATLFGTATKNNYLIYKDHLYARKDNTDYKVYHEGFKPSASDVGAMPLSGGTFTGQIGLQAGAKSALAVDNGASILYRDGVGAWMHNFADGNAIKWGHGTDGSQPMMQLNTSGELAVNGPTYARTGLISQSRAGSNGGTWLALETPEEAAPYISSKVNVENIASVALRFGRTEISAESGKRIAAGEFRVQTDGGLKFAPTNDISGITWGMGINDSTRNLGIHKYDNGIWSAAPIQITPDNAVMMDALVVNGGSESTYHQIRNNGNPSYEMHQPGNSAVMVYKPQNKSVVRFCQSNGAGGEAYGMGEVSIYGFETVNGRFASNYTSSDRSWTSMGQNHFHGYPSNVGGNGTLYGLVGKQVNYAGHWGLEQYHGLYVGDTNADNVAHAFVGTDGGGYLRHWFLYNGGRLQAPQGQDGQSMILAGNGLSGVHANGVDRWGVTGSGILEGSSYGGYGNIVSWAVASFAPASDERLKKNVQPAVKRALDDVDQIKFYSYEWDEHAITRDKKGASIGVLAQEMELLDSNYVRNIRTEGEECLDIKALDITNTLTLALKAIQELSEANKVLTERVATLEAKVSV